MTLELVSGTPVVGGVLGLATLAVWFSARRDFMLRLLTFAAATPILIIASSTGRDGATVLAIGLALVCCWEYARLVNLTHIAQFALTGAVIATILFAHNRATLSTAWLVIASTTLPLLANSNTDRLKQSAAIGWGALWLAGALSELPNMGSLLLPVAVAVSIGDVAAFFGGTIANRAAARHRWCGTKLNSLSPNKTWAGAIVGACGAIATLGVFTAITVPTVVAVTVGAVVGDLIESMVKRSCGVKDAGAWLPGFGGLLDRVDSLLGALIVFGLFA